MEKLKEYKLIIILVLVVLTVAFYWYEWRPANIRAKCAVVPSAEGYLLCLRFEGLKK